MDHGNAQGAAASPVLDIHTEEEAGTLVRLRRHALLAHVADLMGVLPGESELAAQPVCALDSTHLPGLEMLHMLTSRLEQAIKIHSEFGPPVERSPLGAGVPLSTQHASRH